MTKLSRDTFQSNQQNPPSLKKSLSNGNQATDYTN